MSRAARIRACRVPRVGMALGDARRPAVDRAAALRLTADEREAKSRAIACHVSQIEALSAEPGDEVMLHAAAALEHFERDLEVFFVAAQQDDGQGEASTPRGSTTSTAATAMIRGGSRRDGMRSASARSRSPHCPRVGTAGGGAVRPLLTVGPARRARHVTAPPRRGGGAPGTIPGSRRGSCLRRPWRGARRLAVRAVRHDSAVGGATPRRPTCAGPSRSSTGHSPMTDACWRVTGDIPSPTIRRTATTSTPRSGKWSPGRH